MRLAIGAGRGRIVRQLLTESVALAVTGGLVGFVVASGAVALIARLATVDTPRLFQLSINLGSGSLLPRVSELGVDAATLVAALAIATVAGLVLGLVPALTVSRMSTAAALSSSTTRTGISPAAHRMQQALVFAQVALAALLLVGAGLLVRTFVKLQTVETGYDATNLVTFQLVFPPPPPSGERQRDIIERVIERLGSDARVIGAGYTNIAPFLSVTEFSGLFVPPGSTREEMSNDPHRPQTRIVSHTYLPAVGSRILAGRGLRESDDATQPFVFVVNRALVNRYFGGRDPVDTLVRVYRSPDYVEDWRIVGVVDDLVQARLDEQPFPIVYAEMRQILAAGQRMPPDVKIGQGLSGFPTIAVRTQGDWRPVAEGFRPLVQNIDPTIGVGSVVDFETLRYGSLVRPRFYAVLVGLFAAIAAAIAAVGLYAVLAFTIVQRTHEIGVRMALGAQRASVVAGVLRSGVVLTSVGVAVGLAGAAVLTRSLSTMLFGLTPLDAWTYAAVAATLIVVAAIASAVPARRATQVDPVVALRCE
jgi:putative ABC transport system permease protein